MAILYSINMSLDERKEQREWRKHAFESELKYIYEIEIQNGVNSIHGRKANKISECNLVRDILNPPKHTKF